MLVWEPPHRVLFTWQINGSFQFDLDPAHASEIEVRFRSEGPDETVVDVEHRHLDRLVGGGTVRATIEGGGGWALLIDGYANSVGEQR
ncbi:SRPBCC domain-containing protein [Actinomycetospora soli]|uniref:SRPBCC domain-containing protein n=1 Tax=Actinomycetospora soli TaxID=2893887 RepID=UPI001E2FDC8E|nr:SRPBCC domain-containing protein [Actinomycetospora soli]MCD2188125.1 SRPBCC domain-containing protein [Actinomycetospora soli]